MAALLLRRVSRQFSSHTARNMGTFTTVPPHPTKCQATYIFLNGYGEICSRTRTLDAVPTNIEDYPSLAWGWKTKTGIIKDFYMKPVADYPDPFTGGLNRLTLCETYDDNMEPTFNNHRYECKRILDTVAHEDVWFGVEQEYLLVDRHHKPLGWPKEGFNEFHGSFYCGVGANRAFGREIVEEHYRACLQAGLLISGTNSEVTPSQWEFQIGPCEGIAMGDQLWMARYLLHRITEAHNVIASLEPSPENTGFWSGAGCHTNVSTKKTRDQGGLIELQKLVAKLGEHHAEDLASYDMNGGKDNVRRLENMHLNNEFTWGIGDRYASVRIPQHCAVAGKGYFEDRRPASNCDPYLVISTIASRCFHEEKILFHLNN
uniref:glutamine synthetase n=1 Tax=Panagrellus redivivus TaxID=6233 RepID=A0A7E4ZYL5_PANRE